MVAFSTIKVGDVLYDCRKQKQGNSLVSRMATWSVQIVSIDAEKRTAMACWNFNAPRRYYEHQLKRLRRTPVKART